MPLESMAIVFAPKVAQADRSPVGAGHIVDANDVGVAVGHINLARRIGHYAGGSAKRKCKDRRAGTGSSGPVGEVQIVKADNPAVPCVRDINPSQRVKPGGRGQRSRTVPRRTPVAAHYGPVGSVHVVHADQAAVAVVHHPDVPRWIDADALRQ